MKRLIDRLSTSFLALFGGVLVSLGLPPLAWWPLVICGFTCYVIAAERAPQRFRSQFVLGVLFGWGWLAPAMGWMWHLVPGGFVVAPLIFALMHGIAAGFASRVTLRRSDSKTTPIASVTSRIIARAAMHSLAEALRFVIPFGGVPLASVALGVADTRLAHLVRIVGPIGLSFWLFAVSGILAGLWLQRRTFGWRSRSASFGWLAVLVFLQVIAQIAPQGRDTGESLRVAAVQGGGPQAVLAINSNPRDVIDRHLAATALLDADDAIDLVVWPENAIDVRDFTTSKVRNEIMQEAQRIGAVFAIGVTEDAGTAFTNAQIVVDATGNETSRYDKVRRVPYGEYIPLRSLLNAFGAPVNRIPRDAVAGTERAVLAIAGKNSTSATLAVAISWEVFFSGRVNDGVSFGGQLILNPTNGSSYTGDILQQQQIATSQLRAIESGRHLVQIATTGYSAFIDPEGHVLQQIPIGKQAVIFADVPLRSGRTVYSYLGDLPIVGLLFGMLIVIGRRARA